MFGLHGPRAPLLVSQRQWPRLACKRPKHGGAHFFKTTQATGHSIDGIRSPPPLPSLRGAAGQMRSRSKRDAARKHRDSLEDEERVRRLSASTAAGLPAVRAGAMRTIYPGRAARAALLCACAHEARGRRRWEAHARVDAGAHMSARNLVGQYLDLG